MLLFTAWLCQIAAYSRTTGKHEQAVICQLQNRLSQTKEFSASIDSFYFVGVAFGSEIKGMKTAINVLRIGVIGIIALLLCSSRLAVFSLE